MGNTCINFRRNRKRLQEEELNFRRKMDERIQQSSKRLKTIPLEQLNQVINGNDLMNMRPKLHKLDQNKPICTPLRLNSDGQFVEIDEKYIETYLNNLDKQKLISNLNLNSNLFDQNLFKNKFIYNQFNNNQQLINLNNQLSLSTNSTNLINNNQFNNHNGLIINSNISLNNNNNYLNGSQLNQPTCNNILDFAANRIFSELEYMDNKFNGNFTYLSLDGLTKLNSNSKNFNHHFSTNLNQQQQQNQIPIQFNNLSNLNLNKPIHQFNHFNQNNLSINELNSNLINSRLTYSTYLDTIESSLNNSNKNLKHDRTSLDLLPSINNLSKSKTVLSNSIELPINNNTSIKEENDNYIYNNNNDNDNYIYNNNNNDNYIYNNNKNIEMEPWFFTQINTRTAAEHVLRMKGNSVGAFLVRHAQKIKFTADAPYVLSLKANDTTQSSFDKQYLNLQANLNCFNEKQVKTTKDILHYKIYSHSVCLNCDLVMFYIDPATQFPTIRQLISFYSETDNCGLPIKLVKPCLPFAFQ